jgi:hypothetical protein
LQSRPLLCPASVKVRRLLARCPVCYRVQIYPSLLTPWRLADMNTGKPMTGADALADSVRAFVLLRTVRRQAHPSHSLVLRKRAQARVLDIRAGSDIGRRAKIRKYQQRARKQIISRWFCFVGVALARGVPAAEFPAGCCAKCDVLHCGLKMAHRLPCQRSRCLPLHV